MGTRASRSSWSRDASLAWPTSWPAPASAASRRSCSCSTRCRTRTTSGSLLRSAEAAGVHGVIFPRQRQAPLSPSAVKASAGAVEHLLLAPVEDLPEALSDLRAQGLRIAGADGDAPLTARQSDLRGPLAIVVGSEGQGLGSAVRRRSDLFVRIPMRGSVGSLNAAVAGSILLFEAVAQRDLPEVDRSAQALPDVPVDDDDTADALSEGDAASSTEVVPETDVALSLASAEPPAAPARAKRPKKTAARPPAAVTPDGDDADDSSRRTARLRSTRRPRRLGSGRRARPARRRRPQSGSRLRRQQSSRRLRPRRRRKRPSPRRRRRRRRPQRRRRRRRRRPQRRRRRPRPPPRQERSKPRPSRRRQRPRRLRPRPSPRRHRRRQRPSRHRRRRTPPRQRSRPRHPSRLRPPSRLGPRPPRRTPRSSSGGLVPSARGGGRRERPGGADLA